MATKSEVFPDSDQATVALLALQVAEREDRINPGPEPRKTELVLAAAGLGISEIALLTGKKYDAVAKTISRAKGRS